MSIIVRPRKGEDNQGMIRKFKKLLMIDDPVTAVRDRRYHKSPSVLKKEKNQERKNRVKRAKIFANKKGAVAPTRTPRRGRTDRGDREEGGGYRGRREE